VQVVSKYETGPNRTFTKEEWRQIMDGLPMGIPIHLQQSLRVAACLAAKDAEIRAAQAVKLQEAAIKALTAGL
jgi:hypothetical protein